MKRVFVIGASNMDICAKSDMSIIAEDSNIGKVSTASGGVGRNIAVALKYLGFDVLFLTAIANDTFGRSILSSLENCGIETVLPLLGSSTDISSLAKSNLSNANLNNSNLRTGVYSYILDCNGALCCGINDMSINEELKPEIVLQHNNVLKEASYVVFETNIPQETIKVLGELASQSGEDMKNMKLVADCVSISKCKKLLPILDSLYLLKANYQEACTLVNVESSGPKDPKAIAQKLAGLGLQRGIITLGKDGAFCFECHGFENGGLEWYRVLPPFGADVINTNGCGDVLLSGFLKALSKGESLKSALESGQHAASINAKSNDAVSRELQTLC